MQEEVKACCFIRLGQKRSVQESKLLPKPYKRLAQEKQLLQLHTSNIQDEISQYLGHMITLNINQSETEIDP